MVLQNPSSKTEENKEFSSVFSEASKITIEALLDRLCHYEQDTQEMKDGIKSKAASVCCHLYYARLRLTICHKET
jgi:hypothetical protein